MKRAVLLVTALAACSSPSSPAQDAGPPSWTLVAQGLQPALLCVWGTAQDDVFTVGGPLGDGTPSTVMHYDGRGWTDLAPGGTETFWWTHGTSDHDVWAVGENGRIVHWDGSRFAEAASGTKATLYGVWAASASDVWAVGGTPEGGASQPNDVLLHYDGTSWSPSPLPMKLGRTFFKVWGTSSNNLYVVGELGTIWHRAGTTWALEANLPKPLATGNLTTVAGCSATEVYAVGGQDVLVSDGKTWSRVPITIDNAGFNGVSCSAPGRAVLVGYAGFLARLVDGKWQTDTSSAIPQDFHGAWADPRGGFWAAGGDFTSAARPGASRDGTLAYRGNESVAGAQGM